MACGNGDALAADIGVAGRIFAPTLDCALEGFVGVSNGLDSCSTDKLAKTFGITLGCSCSCCCATLSASLRAFRLCFLVKLGSWFSIFTPSCDCDSRLRMRSGGASMASRSGDGSRASSELLNSDSSNGGRGSVGGKPRVSKSFPKLPRPTPPSTNMGSRGSDRSVGDPTSWTSESMRSNTGPKFQPESGGCEGISGYTSFSGVVL